MHCLVMMTGCAGQPTPSTEVTHRRGNEPLFLKQPLKSNALTKRYQKRADEKTLDWPGGDVAFGGRLHRGGSFAAACGTAGGLADCRARRFFLHAARARA